MQKGQKMSDAEKLKHSQSLKLRNKQFGRAGGVPKGYKFSDEVKNRMSVGQNLAYKNGTRKAPWAGKKRPNISGEKNYNWKGRPFGENHFLRNSLEMKLCRIACFERDNYTCVWCGKRGGKLNADHIKPWRDYPELRFALDNLRTLCLLCHRKTDTYGCRLLAKQFVKE